MVPHVLLILVPAPSRGPVPPSPLSPVQVEVVPRTREDLSTGHHLAVAWATAARQKKRECSNLCRDNSPIYDECQTQSVKALEQPRERAHQDESNDAPQQDLKLAHRLWAIIGIVSMGPVSNGRAKSFVYWLWHSS